MSDEEQLQKEWRSIVINKLDSLDSEIRSVQGDIKTAIAYGREVQDLKVKQDNLDKKMADMERKNLEVKQDIIKEINEKFVTKEDFGPIKKILYSGVGLVLLTVLAQILGLILKYSAPISIPLTK